MLAQFIINGLITGVVYSLVALGFAIVYNTTRIFHIAFTILYMIAPYLVYSLYSKAGYPLIFSSIAAIVCVALISILIELIVYKPLVKKKSSLNVIMISSIGIMIVGINAIALIYGNDTKILNSSISNTISFGNIIITYTQLTQFLICAFAITGFMVFLKNSKFGIKTRAMRDNVALCNVFALNVPKFRLGLYALSGAFAALGGILVSYDVGMDPYIGMPMFLNAVVALIIGGIGKFHAPIIGGILIGLLQSLVVWKFSANWQDLMTFGILIIFLIFRPQGLFGEKQRLV